MEDELHQILESMGYLKAKAEAYERCLENNSAKLVDLAERIATLREEVVELKTKAATWGSMAGLVVAVLVSLLQWLLRGMR